MLNEVFKGRVMTRAQRKREYDTLKQALGGNQARNKDTDVIYDDDIILIIKTFPMRRTPIPVLLANHLVFPITTYMRILLTNK